MLKILSLNNEIYRKGGVGPSLFFMILMLFCCCRISY
nr:MAG TPA: hypothetical protein [Caudoviricetes sp.]